MLLDDCSWSDTREQSEDFLKGPASGRKLTPEVKNGLMSWREMCACVCERVFATYGGPKY